ncbi:MAG: LPP20 family lipoprotein [Chlamydiae bacterium]|nr:LPP20 family lipoprotein [Chlamydiota bacterium]MBI3267076.1 LPP20 family lipoprotein [Chlamydiota bacterium]
MKKLASVLTLFAFAWVMASPSWALQPAQEKLLAKRAAVADAYRNLAERIKGLQINATTYVRDFVAEADEINTELDTFIKGVRVGPPRYFEDGSAEVSVEVTLEEVVQQLQRVYTVYHHLCHDHVYSFDQMVTVNRQKVIRETGHGAPRLNPGEAPLPPMGESVSAVPSTGVPGWESVTAQGRMMAERAAKVDAYRNMAERIKGLQITADTYVRDFVAESDQVTTKVDTFIKGMRTAGPYRYLPDGTCQVDVEVAIQTVVKELTTIRDWYIHYDPYHHWAHEHLRTTKFEEVLDFYPKKVIRVTGEGVPPEKYMTAPQEAQGPVAMVQPTTPEWALQVVSATGTGIPPEGQTGMEAKLAAARAAEMDAKRNLAEMVYGVRIDSQTTVKDFTVQNDDIHAQVQTFLAGAQVSEPRYLEDGSAQVDVQLSLAGLWEKLRKYRM